MSQFNMSQRGSCQRCLRAGTHATTIPVIPVIPVLRTETPSAEIGIIHQVKSVNNDSLLHSFRKMYYFRLVSDGQLFYPTYRLLLDT